MTLDGRFVLTFSFALLLGMAAGSADPCAGPLLDWGFGAGEPEALLRDLRRDCPALRVIALSGRPEARRAALAAGADAFVSKADPPEQLIGAIEALDSFAVLKGD